MYWQTLLWPFRPSPLIATGIYTLVSVVFTAWAAMDFWVGVIVMTIGLPVWYSVFGMASLWASKAMTQVASGLFDERIDRETELNPFQSSQALKLGLAHLLVFVMVFSNGPELRWNLLLPAFFFPMMWLSVVFDESLLGGFEPAQMGRVLSGLNVAYPVAIVLMSGSVGFMHYTLLYSSSLMFILASMMLFLWANILFGLLLYAHRRGLRLHTMKSPEQALAIDVEAERRELDALFHQLHLHASNGDHVRAIAALDEFVGDEGETLDPILHLRLLDFQDERLYLEHGVRYLERLLDRGEDRKAWLLMKECLAADRRFRPPEPSAILKLTRAAGREDVKLVNELLADFDRAYPASELIPDAWFRRARICIELLRDGDTGMTLLRRIASEYPQFAASDTFQRYRKRLNVRTAS